MHMADVCFIKKMGSLMPWRIKIRDILRLYQFHITNDLSVRSCRETRLKVGVLILRRITLASIVASQNSTVRPLRYYGESHWQVLWHHRTVLYIRYDTVRPLRYTENHSDRSSAETQIRIRRRRRMNPIYIAQFDTNGILTALYIVTTYIKMQYVHV